MRGNDILVGLLTTHARRSGVMPNTGWTNEARAASIAVRQAKARARASAAASGRAGVPQETEAQRNARMDAADQAADARHEPGLRDGTAPVKSSTPDGEEESQRDLMFDEQRQIAGKDFHGNWYPQGDDGGLSNPYVGKTADDAPYGYHEITGKPRKDPLYSRTGMPIVPRSKADWDAKDSDLSLWQKLNTPRDQWPSEKKDAYGQKVQSLAFELGAFGSKRDWMAQHPGATESQWMAADAANYAMTKRVTREWKAADPRREWTKAGRQRARGSSSGEGGEE